MRSSVNGPQDLRYLGQRLEWLRTRLHELEEQQTRFLRHVSHELKTPLTAVREGAELLRDNVGGELSPEQQEIVRIVRENTLSLQKLIEDLLTYHQTRAHGAGNARPGRAGRRRAARGARAEARRVRAHDHVRGEARSRRSVIGDTEKIRARSSTTCCRNAIKYSPRSGDDRARARRRASGFAVLDVIDQGPGVARPTARASSNRSTRARRRPTAAIKGSGLGLAIAREYAIAHGGRIEVLDRADGRRGAWFRLWLAAGDARTARARPRRQTHHRPGGREG